MSKVLIDIKKIKMIGMRILRTQYWQIYYRVQYLISKIFKYKKYKNTILYLLTLALSITSILIYPKINRLLGPHIIEADLPAILSTLGGSIIGATTIAFSLIVFAMQINVERMPHGLFQRFSLDFKLFSYFVIILILSVIIASISLFAELLTPILIIELSRCAAAASS